ncbi:DUF4158 domain-containing protein [Streptomyces sp. SP18CS02]|uniref:DUF4158 domain-containing protein n=1 Tax=Streptomyces sp. SP18CS02 TaxID=3002531 RepID=UPI002E762F17|nr:DUF4158 domain-containing protein [Streptomyces sp. SP18CS02]MEE1752928.1 DUF4158 domain-containing protein [Streptomyces sp. SP18CS02]
MRQEWSPEELLANWTLVDGDWGLVANKSGTTRLGFSLLLKFFELEGRFPDVLEEVPPAAVEYVAELVKVQATDFAKYTLVGRTAEYHRKQIREALGLRPPTLADEESLTAWLAVEVCPVELVEDRQREVLLVECRTRKVEPPGPTRVEKVLVAARGRWERAFCARTIERLGPVGRNRLLALVAEDAMKLLKKYADVDGKTRFYGPAVDEPPMDGVVRKDWREAVVDDRGRIERIPYELCVLVALRDAVRRREIYVEGAARWKNPEDDLPGDFEATRAVHYAAIRQPLNPRTFIADLKKRMTAGLDGLTAALADGSAGGAKVTTRRGEPWITVSKLEPLAEPTGLQALKDEVVGRWGVLDLLDVLKNADFMTGFTDEFSSVAAYERIDRDAETSMLALHLLQSALVHVNTLLVQQILAEPAWASRLSDEDRRGPTALFWSNVNPYGTFRLDMDKRLDLGLSAGVPRPRKAADAGDRTSAETR